MSAASPTEERRATALASRRRRTMCSPAGGNQGDFSSALFLNGRGGQRPPTPPSPAGPQMAQHFAHRSVMVGPVVDEFTRLPAGLVVDATAGGGGHSAAILEACPQLTLLAVDRDPVAVAAASERLAPFGPRAEVVHATFAQLAELLGGRRPVGLLLDLGVSSPQLDEASRGFSWRFDAPLDMRMDQGRGQSAAEYLAEVDEAELTTLLRAHGEGRLSRRIAEAIVRARPTTTAALAAVVESAVPAALRRRGHPARRVFQALRVEVNDEARQLEQVLAQALELLLPGGSLVVLSYHSGEDRVVKAAFDEAASGGCSCPPRLPCACGAESLGRPASRSARKATPDEVAGNPRAEAARMRVFYRGGGA